MSIDADATQMPTSAGRHRSTWTEFGEHTGWQSHYATAGGRLRSYDPLANSRSDDRVRAALSQVAVYVADTASDLPSVSTQLATQVLRRILSRGHRPPVDPIVEQEILDRTGLTEHTVQARHPGDLGQRLKEREPISVAKHSSAVGHRETFEFGMTRHEGRRSIRCSPPTPSCSSCDSGWNNIWELPQVTGSSRRHHLIGWSRAAAVKASGASTSSCVTR